MSNNKNLSLKLQIDGSGNIKGFISNVNNDLKAFGNQAEKSNNQATSGFSKTRQGVESISAQLARAKAELIGFFAVSKLIDMGRDAIHTADEYKSLHGQLSLVTEGATELANVQARLHEIAIQTRSDLGAQTKLYSALSPSFKEMGKDTNESLSIIETYNKALALTSPTAEEASAATLQFSQAMGSGVLRGDEFNSIMENGRGVAQALADGLGVPIGALRQMAEQGQLTSEVVINALESQSSTIDQKFTQLPLTVSGAMQNLRTEMMVSIGQFDQTVGATQKLANGIIFLSQHTEDLAEVIGVALTVGALTKVTPAMYSFAAANTVVTASMVRQQVMAVALTISMHGLKGAVIVTTVAMNALFASTLRFMRTPWGAAATAAVAGIAYLATKSDDASDSTNKLVAQLDAQNTQLQQLKENADGTATSLVNLNKEVKDLIGLNLQAEFNTIHKGELAAAALQKQIDLNQEWLDQQQKIAEANSYFDHQTFAEATPSATGDWSQMLSDQTGSFDEQTKSISDQIDKMAASANSFGEAWTRTGNQVIDAMSSVGQAMEKYNGQELKYTKLINQAKADGGVETKKIQGLEKARADASIKGSMAMLDASVAMFKDGSDAQKAAYDASVAMHAAEMIQMLRTSETMGVAAILKQLSGGDPYTAIPRALAVSAMVAGLLTQIGGTFGGVGGASAAVASQPAPDAGVLGGGTSESVANSLKYMQDIEADQYNELKGIYSEMVDLNNNLTGAVTTLYATGDLSGLSSHTSAYQKSDAQKFLDSIISTDENAQGSALVKLISGIPFGQQLAGIIGGAVNSLAVGLGFGGTSRSTSDYGLSIGGTLANQAIGGYETIQYSRDPGWFQKTKFWTETNYKSISADSQNALALVFNNMHDAVVDMGDLIGRDVKAQADNFAISIGNISMTGSSSDIQKRLQEAFSTQSDKLAYQLFPDIVNGYRKVSESAFDTLSRVVTDKVATGDILSMTGQQFVGDAIAISEGLITIAGSLNNLKSAADSYYNDFFTDAEKATRNQQQLTEALAQQNLTLPSTREAYRALVESLDLSTAAGQNQYVTLMNLESAANDYYKSLDDVQAALRTDIINQFTTALQDQASAAQTSISNLSNLKASLDSTFNTVMATVVPSASEYMTAQQTLSDALAAAQAGNIPTLSSLQTTLSVLSRNNEANYATFADYQKDQVHTADMLQQLSGYTDDQLTIEKAMLDALNTQIDQLNQVASNTDLISQLQQISVYVTGTDAAIAQIDGSHATGLPFVPYDGYVAETHVGEGIIDAATMSGLRRYGINVNNNAGNSQEIVVELQRMNALLDAIRQKQDDGFYTLALNTMKTSDTLEKWDAIGTPQNRDYASPSTITTTA